MNERIIWPQAGKYVVAVSGGADSMVLLDLLATSRRGYELVAAHYDHGIRDTSSADAILVESAAKRYGIEYRSESGKLGSVSEAHARTARHDFLERTRSEIGARAVITAHHQDDLIETSLLNLARGTGRRGLAPMQDEAIVRPLVNVTREELRKYAHEHGITWNEDVTNTDISNPRNFLRHELLAGADDAWRGHYLAMIEATAKHNRTIDALIEPLILSNTRETVTLERRTVQDLSLYELQEVITAAAYRLNPDVELERRLVEELALYAKTGRPGTHRPIRGTMVLAVQRDKVVITTK